MEAWGGGSFRSVLDRSVAPYLWRPWYDSVATPAIAKVFFPLSRAWASAVAAEGNLDRFHHTVDDGPPRRAVGQRILNSVDQGWKQYQAVLDEWEAAFFGGNGDRTLLDGLEKRRLAAARKAMALRTGFLPGHLERPFPAARFDVEKEPSVTRRHGDRRHSPDGGMIPDPSAKVVASENFQRDGVRWSWGRCDAPPGIDALPAEARIREPARSRPRATLVFAHGIGMETEMWGEQGTIPDWFLAKGFRVIEPQGPWHARRRVSGHYGGEPIFARGPGGLLDYSWTHVREIGTWIAHAKMLDADHPRPVLLAGISLGALTTMQVLSWAGHWPDRARPDHAMLIAPAASLIEVAYRGSLTGGMGVPAALAANGWSEESVAGWAPLLDAGDRPALSPSRILAVLGDVDQITPYQSGEDLVRRWNISAENVFRRNQGHFTVSLGLTASPDPLHRALDVVLG